MAHEDDLHVAKYAVSRGLLSREQIQEALFEMFEMERSTGGERWPLGVMAPAVAIVAAGLAAGRIGRHVECRVAGPAAGHRS